MTRMLALFVFILGFIAPSLASADYRFEIPQMTLVVDVSPDAAVKLSYSITFVNRGQTIDVVDVGLPHDDYDIATMHAWVDGHRVTGSIAPSSYIDVGVEVPLGGLGIGPGRTGTFVFVGRLPDLVFSDTTDATQASLRITPTWFDGGLLSGDTDLRVQVRLPQGVQNDESVVHHGNLAGNSNWELDRWIEGDRTVVEWRWPQARVTGAHMVGVSFPRASMSRVVEITKWDLLWAWWKGSPGVRVGVFAGTVLIFGVAFFRFTGRTGYSLFIVGLIAFGIVAAISPALHAIGTVALVGLGIFLEVRLRRARKAYLPPVISVEGGGIKRGLTAPEAAMLLGLPISRVVTLVLFGMLKKKLLVPEGIDPLRVRTIDALKHADHRNRRKEAGRMGVVIHGYEHSFLDAFATSDAKEPRDVELESAVERMANLTAERLAGHDLDQTRDYYRKTIERAWTEAASIAEAGARREKVDTRLEWLWMHDSAASRFDDLDRSYSPPWFRALPSTGVASMTGTEGRSSGTPGGLPTPSFGDVTGSFAGWFEKVADGITSSLVPKGAVDLGGADKAFGAMFENTGGGGRSGGGGGCACACAGCACACACAGGGR